MKNALKKFIHKFIVDEKGAVSIFLIMILILLFLFNAVLIDFARIMIADRQTEEAANVAIRSTMSSYHQSLQDTGLFAFDGSEGEATEIFKEVFEKSISPNDAGNFDLLGLQSEESELAVDLNMERSLANDDIIEYQILEEMKYKAPVEIGESVIKGFLSVSSQVEEASNYTKVAKEVNELAEDRMEKIEAALELITEAKETLDEVDDFVDADGPKNGYPDIKTTFDITNYHQRYKDELEAIEEADNVDEDSEEAEEIDEEEIEKSRSDTEEFKENAETILNSILYAAKNAYEDVDEAIGLVGEASILNKDIIEAINDPEHSTENDYDNANNLGDQEEGSVDTSALDDYIMEESFFTDLETKLGNAKDALDIETESTGALVPKVEDEFLVDVRNDFEGINSGKMLNNRDHTSQYYDRAVRLIEEAKDLIENTLDEYLSNNGRTSEEMEDEIEDEEDAAEEVQDDLSDDLDKIKEEYENVSAAHADTQKLQELGVLAREYGEASAANNAEFSFEDPSDTADETMSFMDIIFKEIGDILVNSRDKVYLNEYILMRFKSHNFDNSGASAYTFENNQVEYIMYGQETFALNHYAAMTEIFAVRFSINLAYSLINPTNKVFGPLFWAKAITEALRLTATDMTTISNGEPIPIMRNLPRIMMDYKDHLRLFMFIHPDGGKFSRLMAVLEDKTSQDLKEAPTYVTANATTSVRLWFLPQVADILGRANVIDGRVEDNRYYIEKEVNFSY